MISNSLFLALVSFIVGVILIPYLINFSKKRGALADKADGDALKIHKGSISLFGGVGIVVATAVALLLMNNSIALSLILGALPVFILGLWDDFKWKHVKDIKPILKFFLLIGSCFVSALIIFFFGLELNLIPISIISVIFSFATIFVMINAVNYQDGMDGLAGSLVFISLIGFLVSGNALIISICLVVMAAIAAFLVFNLHPAKVFMGDSGAYSLGFLLSAIAITFVKPYNLLIILGIIFIMGLPLFDGVYTNARRLMTGKSIFLGDRSHFYDRLLRKGFSTEKTLAICCAIQSVSVLIGIIILSNNA